MDCLEEVVAQHVLEGHGEASLDPDLADERGSSRIEDRGSRIEDRESGTVAETDGLRPLE